jgi:hypothetical protein
MGTDCRTPLDRFAVAWADRVLKRPWWVVAVAVAAVAAAASGIPKLGFSSSYRAYFGPENPELLAFDELQATYAKSDNILFVVQPQAGGVFTPRALDAVKVLTQEAWRLPYASRVDSVTNFQHSRADGDDLKVGDLVRGGASLGPEELAEKREVALAEPLVRGLLLSPDARTTGVNVVFQYPEESPAEVPASVAGARDLARRIEAEYPGTRVVLSGVTMLNQAFAESGQQDGATLLPAMFTVLVLFMILTMRSVSASLATFAVVGLSAAAALGLAGHLGIQLSPVAVNAPTIIMTLAIADSIHILVSMLAAMREGEGKATALRESLRINFVPVAVTSATTIVGFLTLNFSDAPPFHDLGNITALGIGAAFLLSLTFLPAIVTLLPIRARPRAGGASADRLDRLGAWIVRQRRKVLAATVAAVVLGIAVLPRLDLNDQWVRYFGERVEFRRAADFTDEHLTGLYQVEYSVPAGEPEGVSDPEYLRVLEAFTAWLREQPEVRHVTSYSDVIKRLNKNMHGDDPAFYRIPAERDLAAQYLLTYELSLPFGLDLNDRVAVDKSATRITALLGGEVTTRETRAFLDRSVAWFADHAPARMATVPSGLGVMFAHISERNIESMLTGNALAVLLIAGIMILALRSVRFGLLSLIPNTVPILLTFAIWALAVGTVGMAAAMVSVSALGIVVDDTVHFLTKYLRARRERGLDAPGAVRYAFRTVGSAIVSTTVILTAGFLVLALSNFRINFELGLLTAIAIVLALLADFFLLPALLLLETRSDRKEVASRDVVPA